MPAVTMMHDIDYAALAVRKQIVEKFGRQQPLDELQVFVEGQAIVVVDGALRTSGTRDNLLISLRKAADYSAFYAA